jgi:hypothetical protein
MSESPLPTYKVKILKDNLVKDYAYLEEANQYDINEISRLPDFQCNWARLWDITDFDCEALVKLIYQGEIQGIIKFALYPYPPPSGIPEFTEILNIESLPKETRRVHPVGLWLIWYAVTMCLEYGCSGDSNGSVLLLTSVESAIPYYQDKVKMEGLKWDTISPYEEGYAFRFSNGQAVEFLSEIKSRYGEAIELFK